MARLIDKISMEFFQHGCTEVEKLSDFMDSYAGRYLESVYGELEFCDFKGTNFINVYKNKNKYLLYEAVFYDKCPSVELVGTIIPKRIKHRTARLVKSKYPSMATLSSFGYTSLPHTIDLKGLVDNMHFMRLDENHQYDSPSEYINKILENPDENHTIEKLRPIRDAVLKMLKAIYSNNHLLSSNCTAETRIQKMTSGDSMIRHFGADANEPYIMTALIYYCPYEFNGRELYGGERTHRDFSNYVVNFCDNEDFNSYSDVPSQYKDTFSFAPSNNIMSIVSAFNPRFYHAVAEHKGGGDVYAIITDIRLE
jgi:hypothetical protein